MKKLFLRIYLSYKKIGYRSRKKYTSNEIKSSAIFRKLINHPNSTFLNAPLSNKRYIKNEKLSIFVVLSDFKLIIINHVYSYDIDVNVELSRRLESTFDKKVEHLRLSLEHEMKSQIQHSLVNILDKLN
jgi:hypothetical protein